MTGSKFRELLKRVATSQRDFAIRFDVHEVTVSKWVHGKHKVPPWVPAALDLIDKEHEKGNTK